MNRLTGLLLIVLMITFTPISALTISNVRVIPSETSAEVLWETDVDASAFVHVVDDGQRRVITNEQIGTNHRVMIGNLVAGRTYDYHVVSVSPDAQTRESPVQQFTTLADSSALSFHADLPEYVGASPLTIYGSTRPSALVTLFINDVEVGFTTARNDGSVEFRGVRTVRGSDTLVFRFVVEHAGEQIEQEYQVIVDTTAPVILIDPIVGMSRSDSITISGTSNKPVTIEIFAQLSDGTATQAYRREIDGEFSALINVDDGDNTIRIFATDRAGNEVSLTRTIFVDTQPVSIISDNILDLSPSYTPAVTIRGQVDKPGVQVRIYVNPQEQFRGCDDGDDAIRNNVSACVDFLNSQRGFVETTADSQGRFSKQIALTTFFDWTNFQYQEGPEAAAQIRTGIQDSSDYEQGVAGDLQYSSRGYGVDGQDGRHSVRIVVVDKVGNYDVSEGIIQYASCGVMGQNTENQWNVMMDNVHPGVIQPDLLFEGVAQISFTLDFQYYGRGQHPYIEDIRFSRTELSGVMRDVLDPHQVLNPSDCRVFPPGGTDSRAYVVCPLSRFPPERARNITAAYERLEQMQSLMFPLMMEAQYTFYDEYGNQENRLQNTCFELEVFFDRRIPPSAIPRGFLDSSVSALNATIDAIDQILRPLRTVTLVTTGACLASHLGLFFQATNMHMQCILLPGKRDEIERVLKGARDMDEAWDLLAQLDLCDRNANQGLVSCEPCVEAIARHLEMQKMYTAVCDRIFCPAVPTAQKYISDMSVGSGAVSSACADVQGNPFIHTLVGRGEWSRDVGCGKEYYDQWGHACLMYNIGGGDIVTESERLGQGDRAGGFQGFLNSLNNLEFCRSAEQTNNESFFSNGQWFVNNPRNGQDCYQLAQSLQIADRTGVGDEHQLRETFNLPPAQVSGVADLSTESPISDPCVQTNAQGHLIVVPQMNGQPVRFDETRQGDLTYGTVSTPRSDRTQQIRVMEYESGRFVGQDGQFYVRDNTGVLTPDQQIQSVYVDARGQFVANTTQPGGARGVSGPSRLRGTAVPDILIDPASNLITSVRCLCLPGIQGYLQQIRNILAAVRNCLQSVLVTGEFQPGVCKAVLTQYLCDLIFDAIGCAVQAASTASRGDSDRSSLGGFGNLMRSLSSAGKSVRDYSTNRYGNSESFNALFTQRKLMHAICLAAFGYDWLPELESAVTMGGPGISLETQAIVFPATRRFLSSNPFRQGEATFVYHIGFFIAAGDDINYRVELVCSNDNSCSPEDGFDGGMCDCMHGFGQYPQQYPSAPPIFPDQRNIYGSQSPDPSRIGPFASGITGPLIDSGFVRAGDTTQGRGEIYRSITAPVRYDKVRVVWTPRRTDGLGRGGELVVPIRSIGDEIPASCKFDLLLGRFACDFLVTQQGEVFFNQEPRLVGGQIAIGDQISFDVDVTVLHPPEQPLLDRTPKYIKMTLFDENGIVRSPPIVSPKGFLLESGPRRFPAGVDAPVISQGGTFGFGRSFLSDDSIGIRSIIDMQALQALSFNRYMGIVVEFDGSSCRMGQSFSRYDPIETLINRPVAQMQACNLTTGITIEGNRLPFMVETIEKRTEKLRVVLVFDQIRGLAVECPIGSDTVVWRADISLHDSRALDPNSRISWDNSQFSNTVVFYNGQEQRRSIDIPIFCGVGRVDGSRCDAGFLIQNRCVCGGETISQSEQNIAGVAYPVVFCASNNTVGRLTGSPASWLCNGTSESDCICATQPPTLRFILDPANRVAVCSAGQRCVVESGTLGRCDPAGGGAVGSQGNTTAPNSGGFGSGGPLFPVP